MLTIGVVFGGCSVEHEISILSAIQVMAALKVKDINVIPIYITKNNKFITGKKFDVIETFQTNVRGKRVWFENATLKGRFLKKKLDCVVSCVHGKGMEGGELAGLFEVKKIPYTSIGIMGASLAQDKILLKDVASKHNIDVIPYVGFSYYEWSNERQKVKEEINKLKYPLIVKASSLGSSIGIEYVYEEDKLDYAISKVFKYDERILVEEKLEDFTEYNCALLGLNETSEIEEVRTSNKILTFKDKYEGSKEAIRIIPAEISTDLYEKIISITKKVGLLIHNKGVIRIDYLFNKLSETIYLNEVNTIPGSLAYYLFEPKGIYFEELLTRMINDAIKAHHHQKQLIQVFSSNVLKMKGIKK